MELMCPNDLLYIDLSNTELLLDLEVSGDEEGAQIILPPAHALNSELLRNSSTEWRAIYRYAPDPTYLGADSVFIERCRGGQRDGMRARQIPSRSFSRSSPEAHLAQAALCEAFAF